MRRRLGSSRMVSARGWYVELSLIIVVNSSCSAHLCLLYSFIDWMWGSYMIKHFKGEFIESKGKTSKFVLYGLLGKSHFVFSDITCESASLWWQRCCNFFTWGFITRRHSHWLLRTSSRSVKTSQEITSNIISEIKQKQGFITKWACI